MFIDCITDMQFSLFLHLNVCPLKLGVHLFKKGKIYTSSSNSSQVFKKVVIIIKFVQESNSYKTEC